MSVPVVVQGKEPVYDATSLNQQVAAANTRIQGLQTQIDEHRQRLAITLSTAQQALQALQSINEKAKSTDAKRTELEADLAKLEAQRLQLQTEVDEYNKIVFFTPNDVTGLQKLNETLTKALVVLEATDQGDALDIKNQKFQAEPTGVINLRQSVTPAQPSVTPAQPSVTATPASPPISPPMPPPPPSGAMLQELVAAAASGQ